LQKSGPYLQHLDDYREIVSKGKGQGRFDQWGYGILGKSRHGIHWGEGNLSHRYQTEIFEARFWFPNRTSYDICIKCRDRLTGCIGKGLTLRDPDWQPEHVVLPTGHPLIWKCIIEKQEFPTLNWGPPPIDRLATILIVKFIKGARVLFVEDVHISFRKQWNKSPCKIFSYFEKAG